MLFLSALEQEEKYIENDGGTVMLKIVTSVTSTAMMNTYSHEHNRDHGHDHDEDDDDDDEMMMMIMMMMMMMMMR